jgi:hypothetical protein
VNPGLGAGVRATRDARTLVPAEENSRREGRLPKIPDAEHGATQVAGALNFTTARSWPRRAGVRPARTHTRTRVRLHGTTHHSDDRGTTPARHMSRRRAAGWPSGQPTSDEARRCVHHHCRRRVPGVATASGTSRATRVAARSRKNGDATGARRHEGTLTGKSREGNNAREGKTTMLTAGRRCSRRRLDEEGGASSVFTAASCSGSASLLSRTASPSSGSSCPRRSPAAARQRRRGTQLAPPRFSSPDPSPLAAVHTREWGKPPSGLVGSDIEPGALL